MPQQQQNWLAPADIVNLLHLTEYEVVKSERRLLLPIRIPLVSALVNRMFAILPGIRTMCLCHYMVARSRYPPKEKKYSTTIVIPCRNEQGNIEGAISRTPCFGDHQEIIFVDGHSTDGTQEEIRRMIQLYPDRDIRLLVQDGKGKADAVRKGFAQAHGEILMILDADLTMPPEELPKFYQ